LIVTVFLVFREQALSSTVMPSMGTITPKSRVKLSGVNHSFRSTTIRFPDRF